MTGSGPSSTLPFLRADDYHRGAAGALAAFTVFESQGIGFRSPDPRKPENGFVLGDYGSWRIGRAFGSRGAGPDTGAAHRCRREGDAVRREGGVARQSQTHGFPKIL